MKKTAAVLVVAFAVCLCLVSLPACSSEPSPSEVAKYALEAMKAQDSEALAKYYSGDMSSLEGSISSLNSGDAQMSESQSALMDSFAQKLFDFDYQLGEETINGDTATVMVSISTYAMGTAFAEALTDYFNSAFAMAFGGASQEELENLLYDSLKSKLDALSEKTHTSNVELTLTKGDGGWMLDPLSDEAADAFTGGLISTSETVSEGLSSTGDSAEG